jgi:hypothetical protein
MIVEFMVDFEDRLLFDKDCTVVETHYEENGYDGYDIIEVEVDDLSEIKVTIADEPYAADSAIEFKNGDETRYYVSIWTPLE